MKLIKNMAIITLISLVATSAFANKITIHADQAKLFEINNWTNVTQDDGMIFILGEYINKLLVIHANQTTENGSKADNVTVLCNALNEDNYRQHTVQPGATLICKGNHQDVAFLYTEASDFKNGSQGTYEFQPLN